MWFAATMVGPSLGMRSMPRMRTRKAAPQRMRARTCAVFHFQVNRVGIQRMLLRQPADGGEPSELGER